MPLSQRALSQIRSQLASFSSNNPFPILTEKQAARADTFAKRALSKGKKRNRAAAVLVPLCNVGGEPSILFTLRSANVSTHKNQISFPGGHVEEEDESLIDTALRETREELLGSYNFDDDVDILGVTGSVPAMTGSPVTPVIAAFTKDFIDDENLQKIFVPHSVNDSNREVEVVFRRSIRNLKENETSNYLERLGTAAPIFPGPEGDIWGLTAIVLRPLLHKIIYPAFYEASESGAVR